MFDSYLYLLSICIQILQLSLFKKKKKTSTSRKKYSFLSQNFYGFIYLLYIYIFFKTFQNFCYPNSIQLSQIPHPSSLTYIIFLLFKSQIFLLITILILIHIFHCPTGFQLLIILYLIFKHYSTLP